MSKIEQLIDEIEEYIENCKPKFMSNTEIIVNREEIEELLRELRMKTPDEIKHYQKIISNREAILQDAHDRAASLINEATIQTNELINEHEIMQQAYAQANEIVTYASNQAQEILDNATMEANALRAAAIQYMDEKLAYLENVINASIQSEVSNHDNFMNSMTHFRDVITTNRQELHPVEDLEEVILNGSDDGQDAIS